MRILIAEDDPSLANFLRKRLETENYAIDLVDNGPDAQQLAESHDYDLLLLDVNLPQRSGLDVLAQIRKKKANVPVMMLSAMACTEDRVRGLNLGADDYLAKPFSFSELCARIRVLLRRAQMQDHSILTVDDLELNRLDRSVKRAGKLIELTPKEFALLEYLMRNARRRVTRAMMIEHVWNLSFDTSTNVVDVYINYLRSKIDDGFEAKLIRTVRGVGYQIGADPA